MALTKKSLTLDAESLRELAERRGTSESAVVREVIADALFAEELIDLLQQLHDAGFALTDDDEREPDALPGEAHGN